jgi:pimeloyl-ACP methyl ester carboxylesterase
MPYFRTDGHMLYYKDFTSREGNHSGLTFLCIPGLGESHNSFLPVVRNVGDEHRFILFDNCGSGQSRYSGEEVVVEMIAAGAIGILDTLQVTEKVVVIGHGMGALVASSLAASIPARFLALVAIGPVQPTLANTERLEKWIQMVHTGKSLNSMCARKRSENTRHLTLTREQTKTA